MNSQIQDMVKELVIGNLELGFTEEELKSGEEKCELVFKLTNGYLGYLDKSKAARK